MTRAELYDLVWERPMVHVAKRFGISDVGLRKICVKHAIPTPPLGYWAKVAHGKKVRRAALPLPKPGVGDDVYLVVRPVQEMPEKIVAIEVAACEREAASESKIAVPVELPEKLHRISAAVEKALLRQKPDHEGFVSCRAAGLPHIKIGPSSVTRAVVLIDTIVTTLAIRGHSISNDGDGLRILVEGEPFALRVYETRGKKPHVPTSSDLKRQAEHDEQRKRYPTLYSERQVWEAWDYFPSGRLCMEISDSTRYGSSGVVGRWYDRGSDIWEEHFHAILVALVTAAALAKHRRAEAEERARICAEEAEQRRKEQARRERVKKRREFVMERAEEYAKFRTLEAFASFIASRVGEGGSEPVDRIARVLRGMVAEMEQRFDRATLNDQIGRFGLFADGDVE